MYCENCKSVDCNCESNYNKRICEHFADFRYLIDSMGSEAELVRKYDMRIFLVDKLFELANSVDHSNMVPFEKIIDGVLVRGFDSPPMNYFDFVNKYSAHLYFRFFDDLESTAMEVWHGQNILCKHVNSKFYPEDSGTFVADWVQTMKFVIDLTNYIKNKK